MQLRRTAHERKHRAAAERSERLERYTERMQASIVEARALVARWLTSEVDSAQRACCSASLQELDHLTAADRWTAAERSGVLAVGQLVDLCEQVGRMMEVQDADPDETSTNTGRQIKQELQAWGRRHGKLKTAGPHMGMWAALQGEIWCGSSSRTSWNPCRE